jgi:hypothetical protein
MWSRCRAFDYCEFQVPSFEFRALIAQKDEKALVAYLAGLIPGRVRTMKAAICLDIEKDVKMKKAFRCFGAPRCMSPIVVKV